MNSEKASNRSFKTPAIIPLGGFPLACTTAQELNQKLQQSLIADEKHILFFANTNFIVKCQPLKMQMMQDDTIIVNDGVGVDIATWLVHRTRFQENLNGTDFMLRYLKSAGAHARVFLFGGKPEIAVRAAKFLTDDHKVNIVGCRDGYDQARNSQEVIAAINASQANVLLVAMGNPAQEQWILHHYHKLNLALMAGVGALFDFWAGDKPRAPHLVRKLHLEWLYRLSLEPTRLMRRYTLDIAVFLALCLRAGKGNINQGQQEII